MSSSRRARPLSSGAGQHRSRRRPKVGIALTGAAAFAVLGGGTAFACLGVPHQVSAEFAGGGAHGAQHAGASTGARPAGVIGQASSRTAPPTATPAHRTPTVHRTTRPGTTPSPRPDARSTTAAPSAAPTGASTGAVGGDAVQQVLALINKNRAAAGLSPYTLTAGLNASAAAHDKVMAGGCGLSHQCPGEAAFGDREIAAGVHWTSAGENIGEGGGVGSSDAAIAASAVGLTQMMLDEKAPDDGHRRNILSSGFTRVGIAVYRDGSGTVWLTQDFAD